MALAKDYIIALQSFKGIGSKTLLKVGNHIEDNEVTISSLADLANVLQTLKIKVNKENISVGMLEDAMLLAHRTIDINAREGIGITTYYEDNFPAILRETINEEGKLDPPVILYYKGDLSVCQMPGLAIIGTREITEFGISAGKYLAQEFAKRGFCIVSGLAIGSDTIGHKGALAVGGKTIAFLAHGLDTIYPPENTDLAQQIVDNGGLLLSEYPIGMSVNKYNLVARDRLQAGMSLATLVIQTGEHGGTMHAANTTLKALKPLYTIRFQNPKHNEHEKSLGNSLLVKKGAKYITGSDNLDVIAHDILNHMKPKISLFD